MFLKIFWILLYLTFINGQVYDCDSDIFCYGGILHKLQTLTIFRGSKNFFNKKLKYQYTPDTMKKSFENLEKKPKKALAMVPKFADKYFEDDELLVCAAFETQVMPDLQSLVTNAEYQEFVNKISAMWPMLAVQNNEEQLRYLEHHASVYLPFCFIKADEFTPTMNYYDSYWVIRGLLANGLTNMAEGIIRNYADLITKFGYVLHSNRIYSSRRTQIPLLCLMVEAYFESTEDVEFLLQMLTVMELEFYWWKENRYTEVIVRNKIYYMFHYNSQIRSTPRPEEYSMDLYLADNYLELNHAKEDFYSALRALDESGFGLSRRFLRNNIRVPNAEEEAIWLNLDVSSLIPVELNSVMERYAEMLGTWIIGYRHQGIDDDQIALNYKRISASLRIAIDKTYDQAGFGKNFSTDVHHMHTLNQLMEKASEYQVELLWNENEGMWYDWDVLEERPRNKFSITNLMPLFTTSYEKRNAKYSRGALEYLKSNGIINFDNLQNSAQYFIIPTTMEISGLNWDFPYGSPSLNAFVIEGLQTSNDKECMEVAEELAKVLVKTCYEGYKTQGSLFKEYYSVKVEDKGLGAIASDSEISTAGYASTNGALLALFRKFGKSLNPTDYSHLVTPAPRPGDEQPEGQGEAFPSSSSGRRHRKSKKSEIYTYY